VQVVDQEVLELVGREVAQEWGPDQEAEASQDQERDHAYDGFFPSVHFVWARYRRPDLNGRPCSSEPHPFRQGGAGVLKSVFETCRRHARSALDYVSPTLRSFGSRVLQHPGLT
jgi:hypothetical protein